MVQDGSAAKLLFPADPQRHAEEILPLLDRAFPVSPDSVVVGPMLRITWSELILDASVAVVVELPDPVRISVIGRVEVAVPAPALPLIRLRAAFLGVVDPAVPSMSFLAALTDSNIAGVTITGDAYLLARGGAQADVILSAGGFHPQYTRPAGVPPLDRVAITLAAGPFLSLRCQAYLAITTNTVQFGAAVDLVAEIAGCGLRGHLGFDVLVHLSPLHFTAEIGVTVAVEVFGETLLGISLDLTLEGPAPWRARGRGRIHLFLFSAKLNFDESWGASAAVTAGPPPDLRAILIGAFARQEAWTAHTPLTDTLPVQLNAAGRALLANGTALHPRGSLSVRERALPLGVTIDQFDRAPVPPQRWDVARPTLGGAAVAPVVDEEREQFAPAQFQSMTDDEQLSRPAFESFRAGLRFVGDTVASAENRTADIGYETAVISQVVTGRAQLDVDAGTALAAAEQATSFGHPRPALVATARRRGRRDRRAGVHRGRHVVVHRRHRPRPAPGHRNRAVRAAGRRRGGRPGASVAGRAGLGGTRMTTVTFSSWAQTAVGQALATADGAGPLPAAMFTPGLSLIGPDGAAIPVSRSACGCSDQTPWRPWTPAPCSAGTRRREPATSRTTTSSARSCSRPSCRGCSRRPGPTGAPSCARGLCWWSSRSPPAAWTRVSPRRC